MSLLPFGRLDSYKPRRFVPMDGRVESWEGVEGLFARLAERLEEVGGADELAKWLLDWGELSAFLDEEGTRRYIAMTCHTDDEEAERAYLAFVEEIEPLIKPRQFELGKAYLQHAARAGLESGRYEVFDRDTAVQVRLFREENVALETEEARLGQQYQKLVGALTVNFDGVERTLAQMAPVLEETDRGRREAAWKLVASRRLEEAGRMDSLFDGLLKVRWQMAVNSGFENPRDYYFRKMGRFDYTPEDCVKFHAAVESAVVPVLRRLQAERREAMGLDGLRPWDLAVDPQGREPLKPFHDGADLLARTQRVFDRLHGGLAEDFRKLGQHNLLDLENRKGKAPGGYQSTLAEARLPFIFMNAVGLQGDVETLLHEAGHAFHALASAHDDFYAYRTAIPIEFCEVASMSMELLGNEHLQSFYGEAEIRRARRSHLEGVVEVLGWIATIDAFQHWIYTHEGHTAEERNRAWVEILGRFQGDVNWEGHEAARDRLWHKQLHLFLHPFYYIEYGIAQLGALQVWVRSRENAGKALEDYRRALALGGSRPLPELFAMAGCRFDLGASTVRPLLEEVEKELALLSDE
ncbi:MAG: hypothetical protein RI897_3838 [Verrucomicrobiota bacterium]